jgi:hypothetical protein
MPMKRVWGHVLAGAIASAGVAVIGGAGCVHDDSTIFVSQVLAQQEVTPGMSCMFTSDPTQASISSGTLDAALLSSYTAVTLVGNQLVPRGDPNQPQTETSFVTVQGAVVTLNDTMGNQLDSFTQTAVITIPPSSGTTPGYAPLAVTILNSNVVNPIAARLAAFGRGVQTERVIASIRVFGQTLGGDSVESNLFGFPVDICYGCLVNFSPSENQVSPPPGVPAFQPNCLLAGSGTSSTTSVPCAIGQDLIVDCSACLGLDVCKLGFPPGTGSE